MRTARTATPASLCLLTVLLASACGGEGEVQLGDRLWIDTMPTSPRDAFTAFVVARPREGAPIFGSFYRGSLLRGGHDAVAWIPGDDPEHATLRLLQDDRESAIAVSRCEPSPGFDHCIVLDGDPQGVRRYESRRRWGAPESAAAATPEVLALLRTLASEDTSLAALLPPPPTDAR